MTDDAPLNTWATFESPSVVDEAKREIIAELTSESYGLDLGSMTEAELVMLRDEIDQRLPHTLKELNLENELVAQYLRVKGIQDVAINDQRAPHNQRSQVAAQVASTLQQLVKMQSEWYTTERLKEIEGRLIDTLNLLPREQVEDFFRWYEAK